MGKFDRGTTTFVVVVSGDLAAYSKGDKLTKTMDIADYFREMCLLGEVSLTMDDDAIVAIVKSIPNQPNQDADVADLETWEQEVCSVLESRNKPNDMTGAKTSPLPDTRSSIAIAATSGTTAQAVAAKLDANEHFTQWLKEAAYAPEGVKVSPLNLLRGYLEVYGLTPDNDGYVIGFEKSTLFQEIPSPEAKPSESYLAEHNQKVNKSDYKKFAEFKLPNGETYNWYEDTLENLTFGKVISAELQEIANGSPGAGKQKKDRTGKYKSISLSHLKIKRDLWNTRRTAALKCLKQGIAACYQWRDIIVDMHSKVGIKFAMDNRGKPNATISEGYSTIIVFDRASPENATPYSVSGFNNLDVEKANSGGVGTYDDLIASTSTGERNKDKSIFSPDFLKKSVTDRFVALMPDLNAWIHGVGIAAELQSAMLKRSKGDDSELGFDRAANNLKIEFVEIMRKLTPVYNHINSLSGGEFMGKLEAKRHNEEAEETAKGLAAGEGNKAA
jgi:hypothetical protein